MNDCKQLAQPCNSQIVSHPSEDQHHVNIRQHTCSERAAIDTSDQYKSCFQDEDKYEGTLALFGPWPRKPVTPLGVPPSIQLTSAHERVSASPELSAMARELG